MCPGSRRVTRSGMETFLTNLVLQHISITDERSTEGPIR